MRRNLGTSVSTNCSISAFEAIDVTKIASHLDLMFLSCLNGYIKPNPQMYEKPLTMLGVEPSRCVFVGDGANNELEGAKTVGLATIWVASLQSVAPQSDFTIPDLSELPTVLERIGAERGT